jgi:hypothetical protein
MRFYVSTAFLDTREVIESAGLQMISTTGWAYPIT